MSREERRGKDGPPRASPSKFQPLPTKANFLGPSNCSQKTINNACLASELAHCKKPSNFGTAFGKHQLKAVLTPPPLRLLKVQMFWHSTSFYESQKQPWQCSYGRARMASMPSFTRHACPLCCPHSAAVGLDSRQPNTSSSTASILQQPGTP